MLWRVPRMETAGGLEMSMALAVLGRGAEEGTARRAVRLLLLLLLPPLRLLQLLAGRGELLVDQPRVMACREGLARLSLTCPRRLLVRR